MTPGEIGPKTRFFGPIPAEMGANWRKCEPQAGPPPPRKPCKQAKLRAGERLDRTQEVAGSSPASSIGESLLWSGFSRFDAVEIGGSRRTFGPIFGPIATSRPVSDPGRIPVSCGFERRGRLSSGDLTELLHTSYGSSSRAASAVARGLLSRIALAPRGASMPGQSASSIRRTRQRRQYLRFRSRRVRRRPRLVRTVLC
jgi:hypothetical protein